MTADPLLDRLSRLHPKKIDLSLGRMTRLLAALGHPERHLPPVIHIAGTNGKGSVVAFLDAILARAGHRVHRYTSPHLVRFNERIVLAGAAISDAHLARVIATTEAANGDQPITFFEITTAAAFVAFADVAADVLLLETGLGGRLDATNMVAHPRLTLITSVSRDHEEFLGHDLATIAMEKAGILKSDVPVVVGPQPAVARRAIAARACQIGAPAAVYGRDWTAEVGPAGFALLTRMTGRRDLPKPGLRGPHQIVNAAMAVVGLQNLRGFAVPQIAITDGIREACWPARLQRLTGAVAARLPSGSTVWLDGGHNAAAAGALADTLRRQTDTRPLVLVVGMIASKSPLAYLAPLAPFADQLVAVTVPGQPNAITADAIAAIGRQLRVRSSGVASLADAFAALGRTVTPLRVLICGSLYLAGAALQEDAGKS